ncbi:unnamed protein product [marine sediment metagenome]|uniref:Uncharacterized protein n=1 Tax=marine sediment metagenome TaxID=412755 RepID=X0Z5U4_9ZZZZ
MGNIELKVDGEIIVLNSQQTAQLKKAVQKETSDPQPMNCGNIVISCKAGGVECAYPFVLSSAYMLPPGCKPSSSPLTNHRGRDFNQAELKTFITRLKTFAKIIWPSFE